tara:strand:+ start:723 stop:1121 length:399 start_codon:yes stop_codon:yes gene_type:complete
MENGHPPLTIEERTVANYFVPKEIPSETKIKFYSMSIIDIPVSYIAILSNEKSFSHYENMISNTREVSVKDFPENYQNRDTKEIIAKLVNCKFSTNDIPNDLIEQSFILDISGQKVIYTDDYMKVTRGKNLW